MSLIGRLKWKTIRVTCDFLSFKETLLDQQNLMKKEMLKLNTHLWWKFPGRMGIVCGVFKVIVCGAPRV